MELYVKFMFTLAIGLVGVGVVLMTLLESALRDWDPVLEVRHRWRELARRRSAAIGAEDILAKLEGRRRSNRFVYAEQPPARAIDHRRADPRDMHESEQRVASPDFVEAL
jgi:hypothetical protein